MNELTDRLRKVRDALTTGLVERDIAVRLALLAALAGEHLLLVGPPGTAKSLIARRLQDAFHGSRYFERLLTRFTVPEELFGPLSIKALEQDRYERLTNSYLPTASIAFLDEIFKANSAILNALLTLLNEREFDNGSRREKTPLVTVVGASNELPEGEELDALFDRFLLRLHVGPVSKGAFPDLLKSGTPRDPDVELNDRLTPDDLATLKADAARVSAPDDVVALMCDLRDWCLAEKIDVSDRRWLKIDKLLKVSALTNGRTTVSVWDCWLLQHCLWNDPAEKDKIFQRYASRIGVKASSMEHLVRIVASRERSLENDKGLVAATDDKGRPLYEKTDKTLTTDTSEQKYLDSEPLFVAPENARRYRNGYHVEVDPTHNGTGWSETQLSEMQYYGVPDLADDAQRKTWMNDYKNQLRRDLKRHYKPIKHEPLYIRETLEQITTSITEVNAYKKHTDRQIESLARDIHRHLWVEDDFVTLATSELSQTQAETDALRSRLTRLREEYRRFPQRNADGAAPLDGLHQGASQ